MQDRLLRAIDVCELLNCSRSTLHRVSKRPDFPRKITITPGCVGWMQSEVHAYLESMKGGI